MEKNFAERSFYSTLGGDKSTGRLGASRKDSRRMHTSLDPNKTFTQAATNAFFSNPSGRGVHYPRPCNNRANHYG